MRSPLEESFRLCKRIARREARNFYYSFYALRKRQRRDMCALYAFMRATDDLGDDPDSPRASRAAALDEWEATLNSALEKDAASLSGIWPAFIDAVKRNEIPPRLLHDVIAGVRFDLGDNDQRVRIETFDELDNYCYHVAGAVGLCCVHIWGFDASQRDEVEAAAIDCGRAFQITNILRDVAEDAANGRIYLPEEDLRAFGVAESELSGKPTDSFRALMHYECQRARASYLAARRLFPLLRPPGRRILRAMIDLYRGLLHRIERRRYDVLTKRVRLPRWRKLRIALRAFVSRSPFS